MRRPAAKLVLVLVLIGASPLLGRLFGYRLGLNTPVRCRRGHLFSTIWIPAARLKALDLGIARIQRCPVGAHWSLVVPVRERLLTAEEREVALARHDVWLP
jgi:hypothetical protein